MTQAVFTRLDLRIGTRHLSLTVEDARAIYDTLKTIFEPVETASIHKLFSDGDQSSGMRSGD